MQRMQCIYIATWLIAVFTSPIVIANNTNINGSTNNNGNGTINIFDASSNNDIHTLTGLGNEQLGGFSNHLIDSHNNTIDGGQSNNLVSSDGNMISAISLGDGLFYGAQNNTLINSNNNLLIVTQGSTIIDSDSNTVSGISNNLIESNSNIIGNENSCYSDPASHQERGALTIKIRSLAVITIRSLVR